MKTLSLAPNTDFAPRFTTYTDGEPHTHDFFEFVIISDGTVLHTVEATERFVTVGDILFVPPGTVHNFDTNGSCSHWDVLVSAELFKKVCDFVSEDIYDKLLQKPFLYRQIPLNKVSYLSDEIKNFFLYQNDNYKEMFAKMFTAELLCCFIKDDAELDLKDSPDANSFKLKCIYAIHQYFLQPNALQLVRKELGYDNSYFSKKFKEAFDSSPINYINDLRISYAAFFLKSSDSPIESICYRVGMFSVQFFIKKFKQKYGCTPSQYRKEKTPLNIERE